MLVSKASRGSPPRVRGEVQGGGLTPPGSRITPACAGRSRVRSTTSQSHEDHPRVCGEKRCCRKPRLRVQGSPPRVRGEVLAVVIKVFNLRITPACAGRSSPAGRLVATVKDHPRVCGEKEDEVVGPLALPGSPPRVRGEVRQKRYGYTLQRITPACAGRSLQRQAVR